MRTESSIISRDLLEHLELCEVLRTDSAFCEAVEATVELCWEALGSGHKLLLCGNGGSAADCQHIATELTIRYSNDRVALSAIALTTDTSALTSAGNDFGSQRLFSRQVEALGRENDVLIAISTSGRSKNVIQAAETARNIGIRVVFFGAGTGGDMSEISDISVLVPSETTARIQEVHILVGHILCHQLELRLGAASDKGRDFGSFPVR